MLLCLSTGDFACSWVHFDELIDLADDVAFQAEDDVTFAFAFGGSAGDVGTDAGLGDSFSHAAMAAGVAIMVSNSIGVKRPSAA